MPEPEEGEPWIPYLFRLGLLDTDIDKLMGDLDERTMDVLPYRFTDYLRKHGFAEHWNTYVEKRTSEWIKPSRRKELEEIRLRINRYAIW